MKLKFLIIFISFLLSLWVFGQIPRVDFWQSFILYSLLFGFYALLYHWGVRLSITLNQILFLALVSRLVFMGLPQHSDDFYRFYWDGQLVLHQINPYEHTPKEMMDKGTVPNILKPIYDNLNSQEYHSVYPVTNQIIFALAAKVAGHSILGFVMGVRFLLIIFELISIWALFRILSLLKNDSRQTILYAFNPLIIMEITGNLHFEGVMVTFIFLGLWILMKQKITLAGGLIGTAISVKLTPLILLPYFLKFLGTKKFIWFISTIVFVCGLFFLPIFISGTLDNFFTSIRLYYGTFEFNASIYYLIREVGYLIMGYNMIADISMVLSLIVFVIICYTAWKAKIDNVEQLIFLALSAYFVYLILSMVVHPWYIIPLIGLGILGSMRYPLIWSYLVFLSYYTYSIVPYRENHVLIGIQYGLLAIFAIAEYANHLSPQKSDFK